MVKINRVYTGGGDDGESSLVDGSRRSKADLRFDAVGACDETNSWLGHVLMELRRLPEHEDGGERTSVARVRTVASEALVRVQNELFDVGAELACPPDNVPEYMSLISEAQTDVLVEEMDAWLVDLSALTSFILPTGSAPVASLHVARTVARRLERVAVHLNLSEGEGAVRPTLMVYLNRLSDWLFVLGRWVSYVLNEEETLWVPLGKRPAEGGVGHRVAQIRSNDEDFSSL